jgi:hypothetical protein
MQTSSFTDPNPMSWSVLSEMPFQDRDAGGQWSCGSSKAWGVLQAGNPNFSHFCTSCPSCKSDRFQTRLMVRDAGPPCGATEQYGYGTGAWPYQFAGGSTCPMSEQVPLFQDLYAVKTRPLAEIPIKAPFNPFTL